MKTRQDKHAATERAKNLRMVSDPGLWPRWPLLPMKKFVNGWPSAGFLAATSELYSIEPGKKIKLVLGVIFQIGDKIREKHPELRDRTFFPVSMILETHELVEFESLEAVLDAGWEVD